ncbi:MAG TPA: alanine racemase [Candidatus Saccharicenans sp.]|jgi:alanine racemase|nr:alanine racemase [Candidatus Saccharicenans sp.]HRD03025.1 alanine racemase [Candidatus Saccharicenans sp.]
MKAGNGMIQWVEIDRKAFFNNLDEFKKRLGRTEVMAVVKANAYGHGLLEIARLSREAGLNWLGVNSLEEGLTLRRAGFNQKILILGYVSLDQAEAAVEADLRCVAYNLENLKALARAARRLQKRAIIHLKVETGTNRQGIPVKQLGSIVREIKKLPEIEVEGVSSHFANIEDTTDDYYPKRQLANFIEAVHFLEENGQVIPVKHLACSAAAILFPETFFDLARIGLGLYGLWPSKETLISCQQRGQEPLKLKPVLSWRTKVAQIKTVPAGSYIGYGCTYRTTRRSQLAVIPVGYYDGYDRSLSNAAYVLIKGHRAQVRGRVCMDFIMADITDIPGVELEDRVTLLGTDGREKITAEQLASLAGTINYEIVTRINQLIPRVIV